MPPQITNYITLKQFLKTEKLPPLFSAVTFPKDALGPENFLPINIACIDDHPIVDHVAQDHNIFSLSRYSQYQITKRSTASLLRNIDTKDWIDYTLQTSKSQSDLLPHILVFKPSPALEIICEKNNWKLLANPSKLNRKFENKNIFAKILTELGISQPSYEIVKLFDINYQTHSTKYGPTFFLQFPRGFAGSSTFFIENEQQLTDLKNKFPNKPCKISQTIIGETYSVNACVTQNNGIIIQKPFYQITGITELNTSPGGTCGNDYSIKLTELKDKNQLAQDIKKIGNYLKKENYKGIFGLDFVVDKETGQYYFIECNPRLTASIPMITKLQIKNHEVPLLALHILELLSIPYSLSQESIDTIAHHPKQGAQIIFRNVSGQPNTPPFSFQSGIYTTPTPFQTIYDLKNTIINQPDNLLFLRPARDILAIENKSEFLLLSEPNNKIISPDIEYLRIQTIN